MTELDKLEKYLNNNNIPYQRIDEKGETEYKLIEKYLTRHQIIVPNRDEWEWDAICHPGSYGYEEGLLEIMGNIVEEELDVEGYLTAEEVIERIENYDKKRIGSKN